MMVMTIPYMESAPALKISVYSLHLHALNQLRALEVFPRNREYFSIKVKYTLTINDIDVYLYNCYS